MKIIESILIIAAATMNVNTAVSPPIPVTVVPDYIHARSFLPPEERFVHIAGGFFSYFDRKSGTLSDANSGSVGTICIELDGLRHQSRYVYQAEGYITVHNDRGTKRCFAMERLDYVQLPDSNAPAFRIVGEGATLVATDSGREIPCLVGELYVETGAGCICYTVAIRGRCENDAERHLWKRIERITAPW